MNESARFKKELLAREYGSNVIKIVGEIAKNPNKTERTNQSKLLIKLIEKMNPSVKYAENAEEILWGHLYIMSDMTLDVDTEFKKPSTEVTKPQKVNYPEAKPKFRHYGKNVDILGDQLSNITDEDDKKEASIAYGKLLKTLYYNWNSNSVSDSVIAKDVSSLTRKNINVDASLIDDDSSNSPFYTKRRGSSNNNRNNGRNNNRNNGRNNNRRRHSN